jgi:hypothetical protein
MLQPLKKTLARRQRAARVCASCGRPGTTDTPLMFVVDDNRFYHYPYCMPNAATASPDPADVTPRTDVRHSQQ